MFTNTRSIHILALSSAALVVVCAAVLLVSVASAEQSGLQAERGRAYDGGHYDYGSQGLQASDGGYLAVGESVDSTGRHEGLLLKADSEGSVEWQKLYGDDRDIFVRSGIPTADGELALTGSIGDP